MREADDESKAYPEGSSEPVGVIVCKQSFHHENRSRNRGYIAMLSVHRNWRKRGIGASLSRFNVEEVKLTVSSSQQPRAAVYRDDEEEWGKRGACTTIRPISSSHCAIGCVGDGI